MIIKKRSSFLFLGARGTWLCRGFEGGPWKSAPRYSIEWSHPIRKTQRGSH
jgi:hypothetical protein